MNLVKVSVSCACLALLGASLYLLADRFFVRPKRAPIAVRTLNRHLLDQPDETFAAEFAAMWAAVADGDDLYETEANVSPACRLTAQAALTLWLSLRTHNATNIVFEAAVYDLVAEIEDGEGSRQHPVQLFCVQIDRMLRSGARAANSTYVRLVERLNRTDDGAGAAAAAKVNRKYYFDHLVDFGNKKWYESRRLNSIPGFERIMIFSWFTNQLNASSALDSDCHALARAIVEVAHQDAYSEKFGRIEERVWSEMVSEVTEYLATASTGQLIFEAAHKTDDFTRQMMRKFDRYLDEDADLGRQLRRAKGVVV